MTMVWHVAVSAAADSAAVAAANFPSLYGLMCSLILLSVEQQFVQLSTLTETATCLVFSGPCPCSYRACLASLGRCLLDRPVILSRLGLITTITITYFCSNSRNQQWHNTALTWVIASCSTPACWSRNPSTGTYLYRK